MCHFQKKENFFGHILKYICGRIRTMTILLKICVQTKRQKNENKSIHYEFSYEKKLLLANWLSVCALCIFQVWPSRSISISEFINVILSGRRK